MATMKSGLRDDQYRALELGEVIHLVSHEWPGGYCWELRVTASFLAAGKPGVKAKRLSDGRQFKLNRFDCGVHLPEDCFFGSNVTPLSRANSRHTSRLQCVFKLSITQWNFCACG